MDGFSIAVNTEFVIAVMQAFKAKEIAWTVMEFRGSGQVIAFRPAASLNPSDPEVAALLMPVERAEGVVDLPGAKKPKRSAQEGKGKAAGLSLQ